MEQLIDINYNTTRGFLVEIHIADIHFASFNPKQQYEFLEHQFLNEIIKLPRIDIISINGDLYDHKVMNNSDGAMYASLFVGRLVDICRDYNATLFIIHGTLEHDADQLKVFYHYLEDKTVDVRIITTIKFEYCKGAKILCIPELYGIDEYLYRKVLLESGQYDSVFMHGTIKGAIYKDIVGNGRLFTIDDFINCRGPIISGHVHTSGCFNGYFYYCGCPYRWKFGEEEDKGFLIVTHDLDSGYHYVDFRKIESFSYTTIKISKLISNDPKDTINYINAIKQDRNIDFIRVQFDINLDGSLERIINSYYRNSNNVKLQFLSRDEAISSNEKKQSDLLSNYKFILDDTLTPEEKFCCYVNQKENIEFITPDKLIKILSDDY